MHSDDESQNTANVARLSGDIQQIIDTIPAFLWGASPDGAVEFLNQRGFDYTGLTLEEQGLELEDLEHPSP